MSKTYLHPIVVFLLCMLLNAVSAQNMLTNLPVLAGTDPYCAAGAYPNLGATGGGAPPKCTHIGADTPLTIPKNTADPDDEVNVVVDWVLVELHAVPRGNDNASNASEAAIGTLLARKPALLLRNGRVVDAEAFVTDSKTRTEIAQCTGVTENANCPDVVFDETTLEDGDDLYIVVRHRTHLDVISSDKATDAGGGVYTHDFTQETASLTSGFKQVLNVSNDPIGISMIAGDVNNDRNVNIVDFQNGIISEYNSIRGYYTADFNLDGNVNITDFQSYFISNYNRARTVAPNLIDN